MLRRGKAERSRSGTGYRRRAFGSRLRFVVTEIISIRSGEPVVQHRLVRL